MQEYDTLKRLVEEAAEDVAKATGGNKAAGTRVRTFAKARTSVAMFLRRSSSLMSMTRDPDGLSIESSRRRAGTAQMLGMTLIGRR